MRKYCLLAIILIVLAVFAMPSFAVVINSSVFLSNIDGWALNEWNLGTGLPVYGWSGTVGNPVGGLHAEGIGDTDSNDHNTREGVVFDKTFNTTGFHNIQVHYNLNAHVMGGIYGADIDLGGGLKNDNGWKDEQLTVQYSTDSVPIGADFTWYANPTKVWTNADWLRRAGGNGNPPLEAYNDVWGSRTIDLSGVTAVNNITNLQLRFRWQFNQGASATVGADWGNLDNITVTGTAITSPDTTPPGPVTGFTATAVDGGKCNLSWTNPSASDFEGVVVVVNGDHVPASKTDGEVVVDQWTFNPGAAGSFTDTGRTPGRIYNYAIWAHDSEPNYSTVVSAPVTMTNYLWLETFDSYANGNLDTVSGGQWAADPANALQVAVTDAESSSPTKSAKIENVSSTAPFGIVSHIGAFNGFDGLLQFHFDLKSPATEGNTFWHVDIQDNSGTGAMFGQIFGWESQGAFVVGSAGSPNFSISAGSWHSFDVVIDTVANVTRFYMDGVYKFAGAHTAGDTAGKVRLWNEVVGPTNVGKKVYIDNMWITDPIHPTVTAPVSGTSITTTVTPTITWSRYAAAAVTNHQVRVCTSDDPEAAVAYDSGTIAGNALSAVTGPLTQNTHLWAFVREQTASGWGAWSPTGNGGFYVTVAAPLAPTVIDPSGSSASARPFIVFTGNAHTSLQAKVTSDLAGSNVIWDSTAITSAAYSVQSNRLNVGSYYAFAKIGNATGWSPWSSPGHPFTITAPSASDMDIRTMSEAGILTSAAAPNDGFLDKLPGFDESGDFTVTLSPATCGNKWMTVHDAYSGGGRRGLRKHRVQTINLDQGITFVTTVAVTHEEGADGAGADWRQANILISDFAAGVCHVAGFKVQTDNIGIMTTDAQGNTADNGGAWTRQTVTTSPDYRIIRVTGHNAIPGDYNSTVWKVYVNENPTAVLTATGTMTATNIETDPSFIAAAWTEDFIGIGSGSTYLGEDLNFDWTAINMTGDYAPGDWDPFGSGTYASIGAAKAATAQTHAASISNPAVITKVISAGSPAVQVGYYAQDIASGFNASGVFIADSSTHGGTVAAGKQITALSGVMVAQANGQALASPLVTISGAADVIPAGMSQKALMGPCISQGLGSRMDTSGMIVKVFGKVKLSNIDYSLFGGIGGYVLYVDDGSGAIDGREVDGDLNPVPGIRFVIRADDPNFAGASIGDYVMVEGIAGYETATLPGPTTAVVRQILYPTVTVLASGV